jgi:hypothetical protein
MGKIFKYNNKLYQANNLDKKLKRLKLNKSDIEIIEEVDNDKLENRFVELTGGNKKEYIPNEEYTLKWYRYRNPNNKYDTFLSDIKKQKYYVNNRVYELES